MALHWIKSTASSSAVNSARFLKQRFKQPITQEKLAINVQNDFPPVFVFLQKASIIKKSNLSQSEIDRSSGNF